jgi:acyl-CoA synthetase (AMP-forming)/AMP-acid ligase II
MSSPANVASHLARMAAAEPTRPAVHFPAGGNRYASVTFAELNADADAIAHGLELAGIRRGTRTVLMVPPSPDFFALTFALFKVAAVPVMIDPGMGVWNLGRCLAEAQPEAFVGIAKAHLARRLLGWARQTLRTTVNAGRWRFFCDTSLSRLRTAGSGRGPYPVPDVGRDETAAVLFTSGSTGAAKGVVYTHGIFAAQVEMLKATYGIEPGEVDLCTFPLFALFGPALGMTCVVPVMDPTRPAQIDPRLTVETLRRFGVTNMFGSPAVVRRLGEWVEQQPHPPPPPLRREGASAPLSVSGKGEGGLGCLLPTLRRVISAGAPASAAAIERFTRLLPESAEVFTPYGATESLPVANIGSREILTETRHLTEQGKGVCVGRPVVGMEVRVIRISDDPIPEWDESLCVPAGEVGEFVVRGPVVTREYYNRPEATRLAKITDPRTGEVLHRMGDVGYLDDRGRLWFCGRKSHRVVTPWGTLFTDMVEPVFNTASGVLRTALVGVTRRGVTYPVLCVERWLPRHAPPGVKVSFRFRPWRELEGDLREIGARHEHTRSVATFLQHPGFPVDVRHNSKIFREKLAVWADRKLGKKWRPQAHLSPRVGVEEARR